VYKYQVNPIMNNKFLTNVKFLDALTFEFKGQCHQKICPWEGVVQRRVVYKYQVNLFCGMEVIAKVYFFRTDSSETRCLPSGHENNVWMNKFKLHIRFEVAFYRETFLRDEEEDS